MKHVIIGAGAAGISASKTIRQLGGGHEIVIISTDDTIHSRCMLGDYISGERDDNTISFIPEGFLEKAGIRWLRGVTVTGVDTDNKRVLFDGGAQGYDKLLIATGTHNIVPPIGQLPEGKNVFGLRHLSDARTIRDNCAKAGNIIIIGAGLVGLGAAYALASMGKKPVLVEALSFIAAKNLDAHAARKYQEKFEKAGCTFHLGCKVADAALSNSGDVTTITLEDGTKLPCDMVIAATTTRPMLDFLAGSGISYDNGVNVNEYLAANIDGVYAAGDATGLSGIWPNAMKQGDVAARNMCGVPTAYDDAFALKNTINFFDIQTLSVGITEPDGNDIVGVCEDRNGYEKIILRDNAVVGMIIQGNLSNSGIWQYLVKNKLSISGIKKQARKLTFADFYGIEEDGSYKWATGAVN